MPTWGTISIRDHDREKSSVTVDLADIGLVGATYASETQNLDEIKDAIALVSLGTIENTVIHKRFPEAGGAPADPNAQRERKWLVRYQDTQAFLDVGNTIGNAGYLDIFTKEIPCAKLVDLLIPNTDRMDIETGDGLTFVTSLEANMRSPYGGTISVLEVLLVGRNN